MLLLSFTVTLSTSPANDVRVLVSSVAGARASDPTVGPGYLVTPEPHVDFNITWNSTLQTFSGGFLTQPDAGSTAQPVQFGPKDAVAYLPSSGQRQRTSTADQYDFQGAVGDTYWIFPSSAPSSNANLSLYLGFSAYGVPDDGTFTGSGGGRILWTVHSVENLTTPSATAFYGYAVTSGNVGMRLTLDPGYPDAEMAMIAKGHSHLNLLFKAPGMYRITFRLRGTLASTGQEVSGLVPAYFGIEQWQIPAATLSYTAWRDLEFNPSQSADPLISGPNIDPDGDGFLNQEEFAFGGYPLVPDADLIRPRLIDAGNAWILTVRQRTNASGLTITPVASAHLEGSPWRADLLTPHGQPRNLREGIDEFDYLLDGSLTDRAFLRVRTELSAP
jgi:surface-anchored protein